MNNQWWNEKFINRRNWMMDHLEDITVTSDEAIILLLIDFFNEFQLPVTHQLLAAKMKKGDDEIDDLLSKLTAKGYLELTLANGKVLFQINGVFEGNHDQLELDASIFDQFETEFARPLSQMEMQRLAEWTSVYHQKLIIYALREALTYDKKSFDYIERILVEWKKRNLTPEDYEDGKR